MYNNIKRIHLVEYCHCDYSWTNTRQWHEVKYIEFFGKTLDIMNEENNFKVTIDNTRHSLETFAKHCPERMEELKKRVVEGRIVISNGGAALARPNHCGDEFFIRNILIAKEEFKEILGEGADGQTFLNADTAFGHGQLPQILRNSGYESYRFMRPLNVLDGKGVPREFIYKGIDGSEIYVSRGDYTSDNGYTYKYLDFSDEEKVLETFKREVIDRSFKLWTSEDLIVFVGGDDIIPLHNMRGEDERLPEILEIWKKHEPETQLFFSDLDTYLKNVKSQKLPVVEGTVEQCELFYSLPLRAEKSLWQDRLRLDKEIVALERLQTMAQSVGVKCDTVKTKQMWSRLIDFAGHAMEYAFACDYEKILGGSHAAIWETKAMQDDAVSCITRKVSGGRDNEYVIFNITETERKGIVPIHITASENINGFKLYESDGREIPYQITNFNLGDKGFADCDFSEIDIVCETTVAPMSAKAVYIMWDGSIATVKAEKDMADFQNDCIIDNGKIILEFKNNRLESITKKESGVKINDPERLKYHKLLQGTSWYVTGIEEETCDYIPKTCKCLSNGPLVYKVITEGELSGHKIRQTITTEKNQAGVNFKTEIWVDKGGFEGWITASFACDRKEMYAGIPFGSEKRDLEGELYSPWKVGEPIDYLLFERGAKNVFFAKNFLSFTAENEPMAIMQGNCKIYYRALERECELFLMQGIKYAERTDRNEKWVTHVSEDINGEGHNVFEYGIYFPETADSFAELHSEVEKERYPLFSSVRLYVDKENTVAEMQMMNIKKGNLILSAAYAENDKYILRLFEPKGLSGTAEIKINLPFAIAYLSDFVGNKKRDAKVAEGKISFDYKPHEIVTIVLTK